MSGRRPVRSLAVALLLLPLAAGAQERPEWREWNRPVEPFRIFGPLFYVGASDIAAYAFVTPEGVILLDGGFPETAPQIEANLKTIGSSIEAVKILLNSHSHFDHAGGLAELKAKSGAQLLASAADAPQLEAGGRGDFAWGDQGLFPPVRVDRRIADRESVTLGGVTLTAQLTPGHTKGCTTWTATLEEGGATREAVFVCSTSVSDPEAYRLAGNPAYPRIAEDYQATFERLRSLPCDLFLAAHGSFFGLEEKAERLRKGMGMTHPFVDPEGYRRYVERSEARFRELLGAARASASAAPTTTTNSPSSDGRPASSTSSSDSRP